MSNKTKALSEFCLSILIAIIAGLIHAIAIKYFIRPSGVILTGTEGIALSTSYYLNDDLMFVILYSFFQSFLLIFSFIKIGWKFSLKSLITILSVIAFLLYLPMIKVASPEPENERIVLVFFGAIILGISKAISLKNRGSTGDEDIIGVYFSEKLRKPVGKVIIFSGVIAMIYGLTLDYIKTQNIAYVINTLIYTTIFIFINSEVVNKLYKRYRFSKLILNVSDCGEVENRIKAILPPERRYTKTVVTGRFYKMDRMEISVILTQEELPETLKQLKLNETQFFAYHTEIDGIIGRFDYKKFS